jgi:hypothetical protein
MRFVLVDNKNTISLRFFSFPSIYIKVIFQIIYTNLIISLFIRRNSNFIALNIDTTLLQRLYSFIPIDLIDLGLKYSLER